MITARPIVCLIALVTCLTTIAGAIAQAPATQPIALDDETRLKSWREDIEILVRDLPTKHKNAFFQTSKVQFEQAAADLSARVPTLTDAQIVINLSGLTAMLGDGHTMIAIDYGRWNLRPYPVFPRVFNDGVFIVQVAANRADLLGAQVLSIDDTPTDQVIERLSKVISHDNEWALKNALVNWLSLAEALKAVGVVADMDHAKFRIRDAQGAERTVELAPLQVSLAQARLVPMKALPNVPAAEVPLSYQRRTVSNWYERIPDSVALYVRYDRCAEGKDKSVKQFADDALKAIADQGIQTVVIDLRRNGGGNSALLRPFIDGLAKWKKQTPNAKLAVLIGRNTFSSAVMNAIELRLDAGAVLYGEPTGGKPNHFGEVRTFELPNSKIAVQYSTKFFKMQEQDTPGVMPDVTVELLSADYFAARDPILQAALKE